MQVGGASTPSTNAQWRAASVHPTFNKFKGPKSEIGWLRSPVIMQGPCVEQAAEAASCVNLPFKRRENSQLPGLRYKLMMWTGTCINCTTTIWIQWTRLWSRSSKCEPSKTGNLEIVATPWANPHTYQRGPVLGHQKHKRIFELCTLIELCTVPSWLWSFRQARNIDARTANFLLLSQQLRGIGATNANEDLR